MKINNLRFSNVFDHNSAQMACPDLARGVVILVLHAESDFDSPGSQNPRKWWLLHENRMKIRWKSDENRWKSMKINENPDVRKKSMKICENQWKSMKTMTPLTFWPWNSQLFHRNYLPKASLYHLSLPEKNMLKRCRGHRFYTFGPPETSSGDETRSLDFDNTTTFWVVFHRLWAEKSTNRWRSENNR